jgi:Asp-tRNA(Asn)/Glu-tRNA(Gln) amidotransferase C subunit
MWFISQWATLGSVVVGTVGGLIAAFTAISAWRRATLQRSEELTQRQLEFRHKQAVFSRDLIKDIFGDVWARAALRMLDWDLYDYEDPKGKRYQIARAEVKRALRTSNLDFSDKEVYIRACFESLYDYLEQMENLVRLEVINFEDIETTFRYYIVRALRADTAHSGFLDYYDYPRVKNFMARFPSRSSVTIQPAAIETGAALKT